MRVIVKTGAAILGAALLSALPGQQSAPSSGPVEFATQVRPILQTNCYECHSGNRPYGGLRLDVRSFAMRAITPGDSAGSRLIHRVLGMGGEARMPQDTGALTAHEIAMLRAWIDQGAVWPDAAAGEEHWAYLRPARPALPAVKQERWIRNPIDRFVLARLEESGLSPSPEASREMLIRRLSLDLTGLPPSPAEIDAFLEDKSADAYERLVDRLLASPRYGERWARPWLDLARYADSDGYERDSRRSIWPYRDWVIAALNRNMPFDEFTIEQLAGDMMPGATESQKIATGFLRNSMFNPEDGVDQEENNWNIQLDRATTVGTVWLGSTIGCAQCHNHKFDPFSQKQFYQLVAFFNNADFARGGKPFTEARLEIASPEQARKRNEINDEIRRWQQQLNEESAENVRLEASWEQGILDAEKQWETLYPARLESTGGSTLTAASDGSILASGANPFEDTYVIEARPGLSNITGIRIEALADRSLPKGGPGRDHYGNFFLHQVKVESGAEGMLETAGIADTAMDDSTANPTQGPGDTLTQLWIVDVSREEENQRLPRQMVLTLERPVTLPARGVLRIRIQQKTDAGRQGLGKFRVSVTNSARPKQIVDVPARLRNALHLPTERQTRQDRQQLMARWRSVAPELAPIRERIAALQDEIRALQIPTTLVMAENPAVTNPKTNIRIRGSFVNRGDDVPADIPPFLGKLPEGQPKNRLTLARWLVSRDNPLTARVTVNHIWETYFGRGIVETSEDFGTQGSRPSHPELLDWLASEFMDRGWDLKALHKLIVTSAAYRQASHTTPESMEKDPANLLISRGARYRVEAEMVRDIALSVSGLLSGKIGGPGVMPYQPGGIWDIPYLNKNDTWTVSTGEDRYRRGIYTFIRRTAPYPSLTVFDAPSREHVTPRRNRTDTPLQALTALNDPAFLEAAVALAERILKEGGASPESRVAYGFRLTTSRRPEREELAVLVSGWSDQEDYFRKHPGEAVALAGNSKSDLASWILFSRALLNLDETLTRP